MRSMAFAIFSIICFLLLSPIALADDYYDFSSSENSDYSYSDEFPAFPQDEAPVRKKPKKAKVSAQASIAPLGEKVIIVNPKTHSWGAYTSDGKLVRSGTATSGAYRCPEDDSSCKTAVGRFRIYRMGDSDCYSTQYPVPDGGAPMPYCMFFNGGQAIHGSNAVYRQNASHGCVRVQPWDAEWLRYNFVDQGTLVIIKPY